MLFQTTCDEYGPHFVWNQIFPYPSPSDDSDGWDVNSTH